MFAGLSFVQSLRTDEEKISRMLYILTRCNDALVDRFFTVLEADNQKYIVDRILNTYNDTADELTACRQLYGPRQELEFRPPPVDQVVDALRSCDVSETEVKALVDEETPAVRNCPPGTGGRSDAGQASLRQNELDSDVEMDRSVHDDDITAVKKTAYESSALPEATALERGRQFGENSTASPVLETDPKVVATETSSGPRSTEPFPVAVEEAGCDQYLEYGSSQTPQAEEPETTGTAIELREYQKELAEPGVRGHNLIICAPTGSGKTYTAGYICRQRRLQAQNKGRRFKAVFIVRIRSLIPQQTEALRHIIGNDVVRQADDKLSLSVLSENFDVVVATAQVRTDCRFDIAQRMVR